MKKLCLLIGIGVLASCSAPKSVYYFDYVKHKSAEDAFNPSLPRLHKEDLTASLDVHPVIAPAADQYTALTVQPAAYRETVRKHIQPDRKERREIRQALREHFRSRTKANRLMHGDEGQGIDDMDNDLKLAILFGAIGITFGLFAGLGTAVWVLAVASLIVGLVFFIRWLLKQ